MSDPLMPHLNFLRPVDGPSLPSPVQGDPKIEGPSFAQYMRDQIGKVNAQQLEATEAVQKLATGETDNPGEVMAAVKKSEIAFSMLLEVRNKLQEAYQDVMRMQI